MAGPTMQAASVLAGVNVLLLLALTSVWLRNYAQFRTALLLGLVAFGGVMLVENALALYFFLSMHSFYAMGPHVPQVVLALRSLEFVALAFLTYATLE